MSVRMTRNPIPMLAAIGVGLIAVGCTITIGPAAGGNPPVPTTITVKAINNTDKPLDPQLYVAAVSAGVDSLFTAANKQTNFGFAGLGLVEAGKEASFNLGCDQQVFIATQGGAFGDDLSAPLGQGQQFILQQNLSVNCGDVVQFTFTADGNTLHTSVSVQPQ